MVKYAMSLCGAAMELIGRQLAKTTYRPCEIATAETAATISWLPESQLVYPSFQT